MRELPKVGDPKGVWAAIDRLTREIQRNKLKPGKDYRIIQNADGVVVDVKAEGTGTSANIPRWG